MKKTDNLPPDVPGFPQNLVSVLGVLDEDDPMTALAGTDTVSVLAAMQAARLTDREMKVILLRYRDGLDLVETGKQFNVTRERIRQIEAKALRKMRWQGSASYGILTLGLMAWVREQVNKKADELTADRMERFKAAWYQEHPMQGAEQEPETSEQDERAALLMKPIEELDLSVRSYNCLKRAGINTVGDLTERTRDSLAYVRNLGRRSLEEIERKLNGLGLSFGDHPLRHAAWVPYEGGKGCVCSNCQCWRVKYERVEYCPQCGAKMDMRVTK